MYIWDGYAPRSGFSDAFQHALRNLGLSVILRNLDFQKDGWTCGYHSLHHISLLAATDDGEDLSSLELPAMEQDFIVDVQTVLNKKSMQKNSELDQILKKTGTSPPHRIIAGELL